MTTLTLGSRGEDVKTIQRLLNLPADGIFGTLTKEAVIAFQRTRNLTPDGVVGKWTLAALQNAEPANSVATPYTVQGGTMPSPTTVPSVSTLVLKKTTRTINRLIIHCSATPEGKDFTVADITRWHKQRGYATIGYHYVIYRDGTIHEGRNINQIGAHTQGYNTGSIGICYIGGLAATTATSPSATSPSATVPAGSPAGSPKDTRTDAQRAALYTLLTQLKKLYPKATIHGHNEFSSKACPSFNVKAEYGNM